ncbi:MAG: hypothetical protein WA947_10495 [Phormidesmis sp.]
MASKVTPLYAQTRTLLKLWAFGGTPVSKSKFKPGGSEAYKTAFSQLVSDSAIDKVKVGRYDRYIVTEDGESQLAKNLMDDNFAFIASVGLKDANAAIQILRKTSSSQASGTQHSDSKQASSNGHQNGNAPDISSYETFTETTLKTYDRLNQDYNLDNLVPIYRIRRELGDRLPRQKFNEWLLEAQANDLVQLMGGDLPNVTADQLEDSVAIPGGGTRFYAKRLR